MIKMTLNGFGNQRLAINKRNAQLAKAFPNGVRCQKCLEYGHWSYECKGKRKYLHRTSRTKRLNQNIEQKITADTKNGKELSKEEPKTKKLKRNNASSGSSISGSSSDSSSDSSSSADSSSSDSESSLSPSSSSSSSESDTD